MGPRPPASAAPRDLLEVQILRVPQCPRRTLGGRVSGDANALGSGEPLVRTNPIKEECGKAVAPICGAEANASSAPPIPRLRRQQGTAWTC